MDYMFLTLDRRDEAPRASVSAEEMEKFFRELADQGVLLDRAGPLRPESEGARVRVRNGVPIVTDGPFAEGAEVLGGYFAVAVPDRAAAIELATRCPHARAGVIEVRAMQFRRAAEASGAPRFVHLYLWGPELTGPDEPRMAEMGGFMRVLAQEGKIIAGARLPPETPPVRVEVRNGKSLVTDGPFAETKEVVAGFSLIQAADRAEAIELAKRTPHAKWDVVVVREVDRGAP